MSLSVYNCHITLTLPDIHCKLLKMCVHPTVKGYDELNQEILDCKYTYDINDNCDYVEPDSGLITKDDDLVVLNLNIRGLYSKLGNLVYLVDHILKDKTPDIITLSETWMSTHTPKFSIPGYKMYSSNQLGKRGGGVAILVKQTLTCRESDLISKEINGVEICCVEIKTGKGPINVLSLYRPPNTNPSQFVRTFKTIVKKVRKNSRELIIGLDHNLDFLKSTLHNPTNDFIEKILDLNMLPSITRPTRITKSSATLIDNILVDHKHCEYLDNYVIIDDTSDHLPCVVVLKDVFLNKKSKIKITSRDMREKNIKRLQTSLMNSDLVSELTRESTVDEKAEYFHTALSKKIDKFCPERTRIVNYQKMRREPWLTTGIMSSIARAKKLYKNRLMKNATERDVNTYTHYNNTLQKNQESK